jgi:serine-type D-Ala-D-Ala carboxypeptidase/endopeptidase (penicillin-binding protein 4)
MSGSRTLLPLVLVLAVGACARAPAPAAPQPQPRFDFAHLADSIVATPPLDRAHLGIMVYDPQTRRVLYEHNGERRFVPASNQKYWPTTTALHLLGADFRYRTPLLGVGIDDDTGSTARALLVVGRGDPTLSARFHGADHAALEQLADSVVAAGIRRVTGDVIIDASYFDQAIIPGTWTFGNLNGTSAPPTAAFAVAEGLFRMDIAPGASVGAPAIVQPVAPAGLVPLASTVATAPAGSNAGTTLRRGPWSDTVHISGGIAHGADARQLRLPMTDPARFAAHVFAAALRARGVVIDGDVRVVSDAAQAAAIRAGGSGGAAARPVHELAAWTSPPMSDIVTAIMRPSQNWIAEQLVRTLGAERGDRGSWSAGVRVQHGFLFDVVGIDSAALRLNDGSGMSHQNLVTPRAVVQLLEHARTAPWYDVFRASLAKPAEPGTLANRLRHLEGRLAGKTGTLSGVNALSGYVQTRDGRELIFVVFSNASGLPGGVVTGAIDMLVTALADGFVP